MNLTWEATLLFYLFQNLSHSPEATLLNYVNNNTLPLSWKSIISFPLPHLISGSASLPIGMITGELGLCWQVMGLDWSTPAPQKCDCLRGIGSSVSNWIRVVLEALIWQLVERESLLFCPHQLQGPHYLSWLRAIVLNIERAQVSRCRHHRSKQI